MSTTLTTQDKFYSTPKQDACQHILSVLLPEPDELLLCFYR